MEISDDYKLFLLGAFSALQNVSGKCRMNPNKSRHTLCSALQRVCEAFGAGCVTNWERGSVSVCAAGISTGL